MIRAKGKFDREAGAAVEAIVEQHEGLCILSLAAVDYISSSGIASLVKISARMGLRIAAIPQNILHTLSLAGIERILSIHDDEAKALNAER